MWKEFKMDAARWIQPQKIGDPAQITFRRGLGLYARHLPLQAMFWFRFGSWLKQKHLPFGGFIQRGLYQNYGLEIQVGANIGGGLYIAHPIGTVIAAESIGENCSIVAAVTIGMRNTWEFPRIGRQVFIGAGARILGGITVGDHAVIGANAVVIQDVPPGATVVGVPARVIKMNGQSVGDQPEPTLSNSLEALENSGMIR